MKEEGKANTEIQSDNSTISQPIHKSKSKKKGIIIGIVIGVLIIVALLSFFYYSKKIKVQTEAGDAESIQEILAKAEIIGPVRYETISTTSMNEVTITTTMKVWQKTPYIRLDSTTAGTTTKMIVHPDAIYFYDASEDKYSKMTVEGMAELTQKPFEELSKEIKESETIKELGTETIDGKLVTIIEYSFTFETVVGESTLTHKLWIWNEKGIPLKSESTSQIEELVTTTTIDYKNFIFEDIPNSVFEIPEDKIIEPST